MREPREDEALEEALLAGLLDPLGRALFAAGVLLLLAMILPATEDAGRPVFLTELLDPSWAPLALVTSTASGIALLLLGRATTLAPKHRALLALTALLAPFALLARHEEAILALLPLHPAQLQRGALLFLTAAVLSAAALLARRDPRAPASRARLLAALALLLAAALALWPHHAGPLVLSLRDHFTAATSDADSIARATLASRLSIALVPITLTALAALRVYLPGRPSNTELGWLLALPAGVMLALGMRRAIATGEDVHVLLAIRSTATLLAAILAGAFSLDALSSRARRLDPGDTDQARIAALLTTAAASACALYLVAARPSTTAVRGLAPLPHAEAWTDAIYAELLPALVESAGEGSDPSPGPAARDQLRRAVELARPAPELARAIEELGGMLEYRVTSPRAIAHAQDHVNRAAEDAGLPYLLDVQLVRYRSSIETITRTYLFTYRIARVRNGHAGTLPLRALWLERADSRGVAEQRLGWKRPGEMRGMIILDSVRGRLNDELAPALAGQSWSTTGRMYARLAELILGDLQRALPEATVSSVRDYFTCETADPLARGDTCPEVQAELEPRLVELLAINVEAHELQHVLDRDDAFIPHAIQRATAGRGDAFSASAAAELSAYLAEIGRGALPRLALIDLAAFARQYPKSAEGVAGRVALQTLRREHESVEDLARLPAGELTQRARESYEALFGAALPETVLE